MGRVGGVGRVDRVGGVGRVCEVGRVGGVGRVDRVGEVEGSGTRHNYYELRPNLGSSSMVKKTLDWDETFD